MLTLQGRRNLLIVLPMFSRPRGYIDLLPSGALPKGLLLRPARR